MKLSRSAQLVVETARTHGAVAYVVGGAVRDFVMDQSTKPKDIDIEIHGMDEVTFRGPFATTLSVFGRVDEVGVSFGVLKFGHDVDISLPRRDSKTGDGHKAFTVTVDTGMTVTEALSRRDFTMNALAYDPTTGEIIDPFGGRADIAAKMIRHIGPAFSEDPLRIMRAVQFATRFGFDVTPETGALCRELIPEMRFLAKERLWGEWEKILTKGLDFGAFHRALDVTGFGRIAPRGIAHHMFVTGRHQTSIAHKFQGSPERAAAILGSWALSCEIGTMYGRADQVAEFFEEMCIPHDLRKAASKFRDGMIYVSAWNDGYWSKTDARQFARTLAPVSLDSVVRASDRFAQAQRVYEAAEAAGVLHGPHKPLVDGHDLMTLGFEPGPIFGVILKAAVEAQDRGLITTREEGMDYVQRHGVPA